jgi:hypothetical protein
VEGGVWACVVGGVGRCWRLETRLIISVSTTPLRRWVNTNKRHECVWVCVYAIEGSLGAVGERTVRHRPCIPGWRSAWSSSVAAMWGHLSAAAMMDEWDVRVS